MFAFGRKKDEANRQERLEAARKYLDETGSVELASKRAGVTQDELAKFIGGTAFDFSALENPKKKFR